MVTDTLESRISRIQEQVCVCRKCHVHHKYILRFCSDFCCCYSTEKSKLPDEIFYLRTQKFQHPVQSLPQIKFFTYLLICCDLSLDRVNTLTQSQMCSCKTVFFNNRCPQQQYSNTVTSYQYSALT